MDYMKVEQEHICGRICRMVVLKSLKRQTSRSLAKAAQLLLSSTRKQANMEIHHYNASMSKTILQVEKTIQIPFPFLHTFPKHREMHHRNPKPSPVPIDPRPEAFDRRLRML